jgi:type I restriction enzyme R subunit
MNRGNFLVRKHLRAVDRFSVAAAWQHFTMADTDAAAELAGLPSAVDISDTDEAARRFDALILDAELAVAAGEPVAAGVVSRVIQVAEALTERRGIPDVDAQAALIAAVGDPAWWDTVSLARLEQVRARLRGLVRLIDRINQRPLQTDFQDTLVARETDITRVVPGINRKAFRERMLGFLGEHADDVALHKLRTGRSLTDLDLQQLEAILVGAVDPDTLHAQAVEAGGLGRLIRSIVGLDRSAVEEALADFVAAPGFTTRQHVFVDLVVQQLTIAGYLAPQRLYEDPFTGVAPDGPDALFTDAQITELIDRLRRIDATADPTPDAATA